MTFLKDCTLLSYLVEGGVGGSEDSEGARAGQPLHHASSLEGGVEGGEVLILSNQSGNTLAHWLGGGSWLLDRAAREDIGVGSAVSMLDMVGQWGSVGEVVVESSLGSGHIGKSLLLLGQEEWVQRLKH